MMSRPLSELQNTHVLSGLTALKGLIRISQLLRIFICVALVISYLTVYCFPAMILFNGNEFKALTLLFFEQKSGPNSRSWRWREQALEGQDHEVHLEQVMCPQ